jgi:hypothetical protein
VLRLISFLIAPVVVRILLSLGELIPYVGPLLQQLNPVIAFFIFIGLGLFAAEKASKLTPARRTLFLAYTLVVCSLTYISAYVAGYYTFPVTVARAVAAEKHVELTYEQASTSVRELLRQETGSDGVIGYAIYSERRQLVGRNLADYAGRQFEEAEGLEGLLGALLNIILHTIPMLLRWILCDKLAWVVEAGLVGLTFWYLFSVVLSYGAYRTA